MFQGSFDFGDTAVDEETFSLILLSISDVDDSGRFQNIDFLQYYVVVLFFYGPSTVSCHFRGQLTYPHCSWASLLGSLPVLSSQSFASN